MESSGTSRGSMSKKRARAEPKTGTANAARVSVGSKVDEYKGLTLSHVPKRNPAEHITVTVVMYYTVAGGVPSEADVVLAIDDLEQLYEETRAGRLADRDKKQTFTSELTVGDMKSVVSNVTDQPYTPDTTYADPNDTPIAELMKA